MKVFSGNYVVSNDFGRAVQIENYNRRFISKADMLGICMQVLPTFDTCCFDAFFGFFQENLLIPFPMGSEQDCYVSIDFIIRCGHEFETMGAATHDELASLLEQSQSCCDCRLNGYYDSLARIVLDRMVTKGDVNATPLGGGVMLYVSKHPREGAKLVRREISLD